jgi:hypothetical protein
MATCAKCGASVGCSCQLIMVFVLIAGKPATV